MSEGEGTRSGAQEQVSERDGRLSFQRVGHCTSTVCDGEVCVGPRKQQGCHGLPNVCVCVVGACVQLPNVTYSTQTASSWLRRTHRTPSRNTSGRISRPETPTRRREAGKPLRVVTAHSWTPRGMPARWWWRICGQLRVRSQEVQRRWRRADRGRGVVDDVGLWAVKGQADGTTAGKS